MLEFDSWQRCETVKRILAGVLQQKGAALLDVGGYPGRMRALLPEHNWIICDPLVDSAGEQLRGNANSLPFKDKTFDYVVSLDTLEHIPELQRQTVLNEMIRVTREGVVLSFPHNAKWVCRAEDIVREAYRKTHHGNEHPWLSEHALFSLPDTEVVVDFLSAHGGQCIILDIGAIDRWTHFQLADLVLETMPESLELAAKLDQIYKDILYCYDFREPAYRKIVFYTADKSPQIDFGLDSYNREKEAMAEMAWQREFLLGLLEQTINSKTQISLKESSIDDSILIPDYLKRLETGLQLWEESYAQAIQEVTEALKWRNNLECRTDFKIYRKIMRFFGKEIEH